MDLKKRLASVKEYECYDVIGCWLLEEFPECFKKYLGNIVETFYLPTRSIVTEPTKVFPKVGRIIEFKMDTAEYYKLFVPGYTPYRGYKTKTITIKEHWENFGDERNPDYRLIGYLKLEMKEPDTNYGPL